MKVPSLREMKARISHSADVARLIGNKEYILITKTGVYIHADWRGMNAEVQVHAIDVMKKYLDDVLEQLEAEDPVVTETRERVKAETKQPTFKQRVQAVQKNSKKAVKKVTVKKK